MDRIDRLWPDPAELLSDDDLVAAIGDAPGVRVNFISSLDGAATRGGKSGGLSSPPDERHFEMLRRASDVVLVAAGTVRAEGYRDLRVSVASVSWRRANGRPDHPVFAIASGRLDLDPASPVFTDAPARPIILTVASAARPERFADVADVVVTGEREVDGARAVGALRERGLTRILCEGGPSFFATLLQADVVDDLYLTVAPTLEGGDAARIVHGDLPASRSMRLRHVLRAGDMLLLRYSRR